MLKHRLKKVLAFLLTVALLQAAFPIAFAAQDNETGYYEKDGYLYFDKTKERDATASELQENEKYVLQLPGNANAREIGCQQLLALCEKEDSIVIGGIRYDIYRADRLKEYLYECDEIIEVSYDGIGLSIEYNSGTKRVSLGYTESGLSELAVYSFEDDSHFYTSDLGTKVTENFRYGSYCQISDALLSEIDALCEEGNWDALKEYDCVEMDDSPISTEELSVPSTSEPMAARAMGFTNDAQMLANLKSNFPMQTNAIYLQNSMYSSILLKNFTVKVTESRNAYTRISADWKSYVATTALEIIQNWLLLSRIDTISILDAIGVVVGWVGNAEQIKSNATLCRSAKYRFSASRDGYVYDTVTHQSYVHVLSYGGTGEYTGGYTSGGIFTWIVSVVPRTAYDYSYSQIANKALELYGKDVKANGGCTLYWP